MATRSNPYGGCRHPGSAGRAVQHPRGAWGPRHETHPKAPRCALCTFSADQHQHSDELGDVGIYHKVDRRPMARAEGYPGRQQYAGRNFWAAGQRAVTDTRPALRRTLTVRGTFVPLQHRSNYEGNDNAMDIFWTSRRAEKIPSEKASQFMFQSKSAEATESLRAKTSDYIKVLPTFAPC